MAKNLQTLIRLNEWTVDQRRRELGEVLGSLESLEAGLEKLRRELVNEQTVVRNAPEEAGFFYANYAEAYIGRRDAVNEGIQRMEEQVAAARERLADSYQELKKYEIAQQVRDTREAREIAIQEQGVLDELGLQAYRRKHA